MLSGEKTRFWPGFAEAFQNAAANASRPATVSATGAFGSAGAWLAIGVASAVGPVPGRTVSDELPPDPQAVSVAASAAPRATSRVVRVQPIAGTSPLARSHSGPPTKDGADRGFVHRRAGSPGTE